MKALQGKAELKPLPPGAVALAIQGPAADAPKTDAPKDAAPAAG